MLKIEAGKFYRTRDGQKVGPMLPTPAKWGYDKEWVWTDKDYDDGAMDDNLWRDDGSCDPHGKPDRFDLIAEWPDLTKITTPFGLLDEVYGPGTQAALKAHGGPYEYFGPGGDWRDWTNTANPWFPELAYRVKPAPPKPREKWITGGNCVYQASKETGWCVNTVSWTKGERPSWYP